VSLTETAVTIFRQLFAISV